MSKKRRRYPDSEHIPGQGDVFMTEFPRLLFEAQERIEELEERVEVSELALARHEEAATCILWLLSRSAIGPGRAVAIRIEVISEMLEEAHRFGAVGVEPSWLTDARRRMGR